MWHEPFKQLMTTGLGLDKSNLSTLSGRVIISANCFMFIIHWVWSLNEITNNIMVLILNEVCVIYTYNDTNILIQISQIHSQPSEIFSKLDIWAADCRFEFWWNINKTIPYTITIFQLTASYLCACLDTMQQS